MAWRSSLPLPLQSLEVPGLLDRESQPLARREGQDASNGGSINPLAGARNRLQAHATFAQQAGRGIQPRNDVIALNSSQRRLRNAGAPAQLLLGQTRPESRKSNNI